MRLAARLEQARKAQFIGRLPERALFEGALSAETLPFVVLYLIGPGGIGKTTLLRQFEQQAQSRGLPTLFLDGRTIEPNPAAFRTAFEQALSQSDFRAAWPDDTSSQKQVLFIDTYENLHAIDGYLRDQFLPQLPEKVLVVLAGRSLASTAWQTDPGWHALTHLLPLRNLDQAESEQFLAQYQVAAEEMTSIFSFTHGHPLALALIADDVSQDHAAHFQPEQNPNVIRTLLERFVQRVPSPAHRMALEACAIVHVTTESILAEMLNIPEAHALFTWLQGLSFIEANERGLFPHDIVREVLATDLRWRNPDHHALLHQRARAYYAEQLQAATALDEQQAILIQYVFLHRDSPVLRPMLHQLQVQQQTASATVIEPIQPADHGAVMDLVTRHEGAVSAQWMAYWLERQPAQIHVARRADGGVEGLVMLLDVTACTPEQRTEDPAVQAMWEYLHTHAPLRPNERATLFRFWMAAETYQAVSPVQSQLFVFMVRHYLTTPGLAFTVHPCTNPDFWQLIFSYAELRRLPEADYTIDGRHHAAFGHDWRLQPPMAWLSALAEREHIAPAPIQPDIAPVAVLNEAAFGEAVHDALRQYTRPDRLLQNPLLRARLVLETSEPNADDAARVAYLKVLLDQAVDVLADAPKGQKYYRALQATYLRPAPSQEQAAERLGLPFSTYRRHLKRGVEHVVTHLWHLEIGSAV